MVASGKLVQLWEIMNQKDQVYWSSFKSSFRLKGLPSVVDVDVVNTNQRFSNSVSEGSGEDRFKSCESDGGDVDVEVTPGSSNEYPAPDEEKRSDSDNDCKPWSLWRSSNRCDKGRLVLLRIFVLIMLDVKCVKIWDFEIWGAWCNLAHLPCRRLVPRVITMRSADTQSVVIVPRAWTLLRME